MFQERRGNLNDVHRKKRLITVNNNLTVLREILGQVSIFKKSQLIEESINTVNKLRNVMHITEPQFATLRHLQPHFKKYHFVVE